MKKVYYILALLILSAIFFSCAKETLVDTTDSIAGANAALVDGGGDAEYDWATHVIRHTADAMSESGTQDAKITANDMNVYKVRVVHF